jgi:UDPglucose--hexose-1-phosphate uridylyltransferase
VRPIALGGKGDTQSACPFCPGGAEGLNGPYEIVTFENKFPSMSPSAQGAGGPALGVAKGNAVRRNGDLDELYRSAPGKGVCEVVLYSPRHDSTLAGESREHIYKLVEVWTDRFRDLGSRSYVKYVYIFENKGAVIGVTLQHPHGQIYAFPFIPPRVATELNAERRYKSRHGKCLLCDLMRAERAAKVRLVAAEEGFTAYLPYFARYPYEVHIVANRHLGHLGELTRGEKWGLAGILKTVLAKYDNLFGFSFPYIMLMHSSPTDGRKHAYHHFHIEFYPPHRSRDKIKFLAGCESGAGTFINDTIAEEKAAELRRTRPITSFR